MSGFQHPLPLAIVATPVQITSCALVAHPARVFPKNSDQDNSPPSWTDVAVLEKAPSKPVLIQRSSGPCCCDELLNGLYCGLGLAVTLFLTQAEHSLLYPPQS